MMASEKDTIGCFVALFGLLVTLPLWLYLLYQVLVRVEATSAMWAAYWVYVPATFIVGIAQSIMKTLGDD